MGTIIKYVTEQVSILDKNYVPIKLRIYDSENIQIQESVSYQIVKRLAGYGQNNVFCNNSFSFSFCFLDKTLRVDNYVLPKKQEVITSYNAYVFTDKLYNNIENLKYENFCEKTRIINDGLLWLVYDTEGDFFERTTTFYYSNDVIFNKVKVNYCLVSGYKRNVEIVGISELFGVKFVGLSVGDILYPNSQLCFQLVIEDQDVYENVKGKWISIKVNDGEKEFYLKYQLCFKRSSFAGGFVFYPDKNSYTETYFFNTLMFRTINGVETGYSTMNNPKVNFSATYSNLEIYKHKFLENINILIERNLNYFPLWSEAVKPREIGNKTNIIKAERLPKTLEVGSKIFLIENELNAYLLTIVDIIDNDIIIEGFVDYSIDNWIVPVVDVMKKNNSSIDRLHNENTMNLEVSSIKPLKGLL